MVTEAVVFVTVAVYVVVLDENVSTKDAPVTDKAERVEMVDGGLIRITARSPLIPNDATVAMRSFPLLSSAAPILRDAPEPTLII